MLFDASLQPGQFYDNCFEGNIRSITPCFGALSSLRTCWSYWSCLGQFGSRFIHTPFIPVFFLRVHSTRISFISPLLNLLQSTKI